MKYVTIANFKMGQPALVTFDDQSKSIKEENEAKEVAEPSKEYEASSEEEQDYRFIHSVEDKAETQKDLLGYFHDLLFCLKVDIYEESKVHTIHMPFKTRSEAKKAKALIDNANNWRERPVKTRIYVFDHAASNWKEESFKDIDADEPKSTAHEDATTETIKIPAWYVVSSIGASYVTLTMPAGESTEGVLVMPANFSLTDGPWGPVIVSPDNQVHDAYEIAQSTKSKDRYSPYVKLFWGKLGSLQKTKMPFIGGPYGRD